MPYLKDGTWKAGVDLTPGDLEDDEEKEGENNDYSDYFPEEDDTDDDLEED